MDFDDFEDTGDPLRQLRELGNAFHDKERFIDRLQAYQAAGWPFGRETKAFLLWAEFGMGTTVN